MLGVAGVVEAMPEKMDERIGQMTRRIRGSMPMRVPHVLAGGSSCPGLRGRARGRAPPN
jgi:hypothetical protein